MKKMLFLCCLVGCSTSKTVSIPLTEYKPGAPPGRPTIYMFSTDQCEPCREAKPVLEREAGLRGDRVVIVDADDDRMMHRLGYRSLPVFRFVRPGAPELVLRGWDKKRFVKAYNHFDEKNFKQR